MATRKRYTRKVIASASAYIDPLNCESTVSYKVIDASTRVWGSIQLADCTRKIEWYFGDDISIDKISKAITMLNDFKEALIIAKEDRKKRVAARRKTTVKK